MQDAGSSLIGSALIGPTPIADSLLSEGRAMLYAVAKDFLNCGHSVITCIDASLGDKLHLFESDSDVQVTRSKGFTNDLPSSWWEIAAEADAVVVIAPEFSTILQNAISKLSPVCKLLLNCNGDFLTNTCDKWLTAQQLTASRLPHPATQLVAELSVPWLEQNRCESGKWIIKPRDGAGCDAIQLADDSTVQSELASIRGTGLDSRMILQPLHSGSAFSRSAIVDTAGRAHWMPLVTQEFTVSDSMVYCGGQVLDASESPDLERLDKILDTTIAALGKNGLGWVGVDLIYGDEVNDWMVIEVNPRLTTSFTGLSASYGCGLMEQMLRAGRGLEVVLKPTWKSVAFDAAGNT